MNNQIRELSPSKPNNERADASAVCEMELGERELSQASGGRGLFSACVKGQHIPVVKIVC
jgi:hypothetical protein